MVAETVVDYIQELNGTRAELEAIAHQDQVVNGVPQTFTMPAEVPMDAKVKIWGGERSCSTSLAVRKYHSSKPLKDWDRQQRGLEYLVARGLWDTRGRLGFSLGIPLGQQFALYHTPTANGEDWRCAAMT